MARRQLPHNVNAEASLLGAILLHNELLPRFTDLDSRAFYHWGHRHVFDAMRELAANGKPIDEVTLAHPLRTRNVLEAIGGLPFLSRLALIMPTADNAQHYADVVRETYAVRSMILAMSEVMERGYGDYGTLAEYQAEALARITNTIHQAMPTGPRSALEVVRALSKELQRRYETGSGITGLPMGFAELDEHTAGLQPTDLIILAARPSIGKTALALCMAKNAAQNGYPVVVFSHEMSAVQLMERLLSAEARVSTRTLRTGALQRQQFEAITRGLPPLCQLPLAIDDTAPLSVHDVRARSLRFASDHHSAPIGLVIVDYLQLMKGSGRSRNREQEIAEISRGLKVLAKALGWPVLAVSQLNRSLESRTDKRPRVADLRESGAIEQDADVVMLLYRDEVYHQDTDDPGVAEVNIAKNRSGATGTFRLGFEGPYTRFTDMAPGSR